VQHFRYEVRRGPLAKIAAPTEARPHGLTVLLTGQCTRRCWSVVERHDYRTREPRVGRSQAHQALVVHDVMSSLIIRCLEMALAFRPPARKIRVRALRFGCYAIASSSSPLKTVALISPRARAHTLSHSLIKKFSLTVQSRSVDRRCANVFPIIFGDISVRAGRTQTVIVRLVTSADWSSSCTAPLRSLIAGSPCLRHGLVRQARMH
jgi:hypothetical protein